MASGHWVKRSKVVIDPETGAHRTVTSWVWVADNLPKTGSTKDQKAAQKKAQKEHQQALLRQAAARQRADAEKRAHAAVLASQKLVAQNRAAAYAKLAQHQHDVLLKAKSLGEKPVALSGDPSNVPAARAAAQKTAADDAAEHAAKAAKQVNNTAYQQQQAATAQAERAYQAKKNRLILPQQGKPVAPGVPVLGPSTTPGVRTAKDAADAESVMAAEVGRAKTGNSNPRDIEKLKAQYDKYAAGVADAYTKAVMSYEDDIAIVTGKFTKDQRARGLGKKKYTYNQRLAAFKRAKETYNGDLSTIWKEYSRLFVGSGKSDEERFANGSYATFMKQSDDVALAQRDWYQSQMKAALDGRANKLQQQSEALHRIRPGKGHDGTRVDKELAYTKETQRIQNSKPGELGEVIDHYEVVTGPDGHRTTRPVYRHRTISEALDAQQARLQAEQQILYDQQIASRQTDLLRDKGLIRAEGLSRINAQGESASPLDVAAGQSKFVDSSTIGAAKEMARWAKDIWGVSDLKDIPPVKREQDLIDQIDKFMVKWDEENPVEHLSSDVALGQRLKSNPATQEQYASMSDAEAGYTYRAQQNEAKRKAFEQQAYQVFGSNDPGALGHLVTTPGVSHLFALLQGGVASIGAGGRIFVIKGMTGGSSRISMGITLNDLPTDVADEIRTAQRGSQPTGIGGIPLTINPGALFQNKLTQDDIVNQFLQSERGQAWYVGWSAQQAALDAQSNKQDEEFLQGFYGQNGSNPLDNASASLDALNAYGQTPFTDDGLNLAFQLLADPTNAIPLKFTTWAARFRYATKAAQLADTGSKGLKALESVKFLRNFVGVDEGVLNLEKRLGSFIKEVAASGKSVEEVKDALRLSIAGIKDPALKETKVVETLRKLGLNPSNIETSQISNIIEWSVNRELDNAGADIFTHHKRAAKQLEEHEAALKAEEKAQQAELKRTTEEAARARAAKETEAAKAREEVRQEFRQEADAARADAEKAAAARGAEDAAKRRAETEAAKVAEPPAAEVAKAAETAPVKPEVPKKPSKPRKPVTGRATLKGRVAQPERVFKPVGEDAPSYSPSEEWFTHTAEGHLVPDPHKSEIGAVLHKQLVGSEEWATLSKKAAAGDKAAERQMGYMADRVVRAYRTALEDVPVSGPRGSHYEPSEFDLAARAGIAADDTERLSRIRSITRFVAKQTGRGNLEDAAAHRLGTGLDDIAPATGRVGRRTKRLESNPKKPEILKDLESREIEKYSTDGDPAITQIEYVDLGADVVEALTSNPRGANGLFSAFSARSRQYFKDAPPFLKRLLDPQYVERKMTPSEFAKLIDGLEAGKLHGSPLTEWRDGGYFMFEVFHQLRRAASNLDDVKRTPHEADLALAKLQEFSAVVDAMFEHGDNETNIFMWQWKIMEHRAGLPWAAELDEILFDASGRPLTLLEGFREAAITQGIPPDLALLQIPSGYMAAQPAWAYGLAKPLRHLADSKTFHLAPRGWKVTDALNTAESIVRKGVGDPQQVVHYVAQRWGDFVKGRPVTSRILHTVADKMASSGNFEELVQSMTRHLLDSDDLGKAYHFRNEGRDFANEFDYLEARRAAFEADKASGEAAADAVYKSPTSVEIANHVMLTKEEFIREQLTALRKRNAEWKTRPSRSGAKPMSPQFENFDNLIMRAYWAGDLAGLPAKTHDLMYLMKLQTPAWGEDVLNSIAVYAKYMEDLGETAHMQDFLAGIHHQRIAALAARFRVESTGAVVGADIVSGVVMNGHNAEYTLFKRLGLLSWDDEVAAAASEQIYHARMVEQFDAAEQAERDLYTATERDAPSDVYTGVLGSQQIEARTKAIANMGPGRAPAPGAPDLRRAYNEEAQYEALSRFVADLMGDGGANMAADDVAHVDELWRQITMQPNGAELMRRVTTEGHEFLQEGRNVETLTALAYHETSLRIEIEKILRVGGAGESRLAYLRKELAEIEARKDEIALAEAVAHGAKRTPSEVPGTYEGLRVVETKIPARGTRSTPAAHYQPEIRKANGDHSPAHIQINSAAIESRWRRKSWTHPPKLADGSRVDAMPRDAFRNRREFTDFIVHHEYLHHVDRMARERLRAAEANLAKIEDQFATAREGSLRKNRLRPDVAEARGALAQAKKEYEGIALDGSETRAAYESRVNKRAYDHIASPRRRSDQILHEMEAMHKPGKKEPKPQFVRRYQELQREKDALAEKYPGSNRTPEFDALRAQMRAGAETDEIAMRDAQAAAAKGEKPEIPPTHIPEGIGISAEERARLDNSAMWLEKLSGMTEGEYREVLRERARAVLRDPKAGPAERQEARDRLSRLDLAQYGEEIKKKTGRHTDWKKRAAYSAHVKKLHGDRAAESFSPKLIAAYSRDAYGTMVEQVRQMRIQRMRMVDENASGIARLGKARSEDHFPLALFEQVEPEVARGVRETRGYAADTHTIRKRGASSTKTVLDDNEKGVLAPTMRDLDERIVAVKTRILAKYGISVRAYDEARKVLLPGILARRNAMTLIRRTDEMVARLEKAGKTVDWDTTFLRLRANDAAKEARKQLGAIANDMVGVDPEVVIREFEKVYGLTGDLEPHVPKPFSAFQKRTLDEAIKERSMGRSMPDVLQSANRPPFEEGREAVRDWLVKHGQWTPRARELFSIGKKSWSVIEEAKYWDEMFGHIPEWTNVELLNTKFKDIFHDIDFYYAQMKSWGIFKKGKELQLRLEGVSAERLELGHIIGDPELSIEQRRSVAEQREYVMDRYGDLVSVLDPATGQRRLTAMPWLMTPDELPLYFAERIQHTLPDGLLQNAKQLDRLNQEIARVMKPHVDEMLKKVAAGEQITYDEILHVTTEIQKVLLSDPIWAKRTRDTLGDGLRMWAKTIRWSVFSNPAFMFMNLSDVPIKTWWYELTRSGLMHAPAGGYARGALERARDLTPANLGLDAQSTIYSLRERKAVDYFRHPREHIRIGPVQIDKNYGIGAPVLRAIESVEGLAHAIPETAGRGELVGKMHLARKMYPAVYTEALAQLGDAELAHLFALDFVKKEMVRMWPTVGDGPLERLFNEFVPFASYSVRNKIMFIGEVAAHPAILNKIEFIGRYVEAQNVAEYEKEHPGQVMPDYLRRRIRLPWTRNSEGDYIYLDLGVFSDAARGIKPLYGSSKNPIATAADWVRLINPTAQAALYLATNAMGVTQRAQYRPVLDSRGFATGSYRLEYTGWTEPWSGDQPDAGSVFWLVDAAQSLQALGADGLDARDATYLIGRMMTFNGLTMTDRGATYNAFYWDLKKTNPAAAKSWLENTDQGHFLQDWLFAKASSLRDVTDSLRDLSKLDQKAWFKLSPQDQADITAGKSTIKNIREVYAAKIAATEYGSNEWRQARAEMYYEINQVYLNNPALMKDSVYSKTSEEWSKQLDDWAVDKLVNDYFDLAGKAPSRLDSKNHAEYEKKLNDWKDAKAHFLIQYPQVKARIESGIGEIQHARDLQNEEWDKLLTRIDERNGMIEHARDVAKKYNYTGKGAEAAQTANLLSISNELDYNLLQRDHAADYFQYEDFQHLGFAGDKPVQGPLSFKAGITLARTAVLPDFGQARWNKAQREGTMDEYLAKEQYGRDIAKAVSYAKGGDPFGVFDGRKWFKYLSDNPGFREKYFANHKGSETTFANSARYVSEVSAAVRFASAGGKFDPGKFVSYVKSHPWLKDQYFGRHKGAREKWERTENYIRHISVWGKLVQSQQWDKAKDAWDSLPQWVKDRYYAKHPERRKRAAQTGAYLGYMKKWVSMFDSAPKGEAMKYFKSLPKWVKDRYYAKHPDKKMKWETDTRMWTKAQSYFASGDAGSQAAYLKANPDLAKWLHQYGGGGKTSMILGVYASIKDPWLRSVYRERYPEIFSPEAKGEQKLKSVFRTLQAHPEMEAGFEKWLKAQQDAYAEMMRLGQKRPANALVLADRKTPARKFVKSLSAAQSSR